MTRKTSINEINERYIELWKEFQQENKIDEIPSLYPELKKDALLFVGLNPSCPDTKLEGRNGRLEEIGSDKSARDFKTWIYPLPEERKKEIINERKIARGENVDSAYSYFKPFYRISEEVELDWEHIDVFRTIAEKQSELKDILDMYSKGENISDFGRKQIDIFKELLEKLEPKIIIVQSALAGDIIKNELEISDATWSQEGFHTIKINNKDVPIFFTGMLSVGYDKGSRKRLIWHVKKAKEWVKKNGSSKT